MAGRKLPVIPESGLAAPDNLQGSLDAEGRRHFVHPADVHGRFTRLRRVIFAVLIGIWIALPSIRIHGVPLIQLDIVHRRFHLFGATFNAQDIYLVFFLLTGLGFGLAAATSLLGRVFCGYACPQTVFLESFFRPIERLVEGPRAARLRLAAAPMSVGKFARKALKHTLYILAAFLTAHVFIAFFVPLPDVVRMVLSKPSAHPEAFGWAVAVTALVYGNFAFAREQVCLVVCPYGRLQSILVDPDSVVIGYDKKRGEPRGKVHEEHVGDCVDCKRCVAVCPTGIDIRNGLQLDCVGCAACVDACDEVMDKLQRPRGLVRYDSQNGLIGEKRRIWRPRLAIYAVLGLIGLTVATITISRRTSFEANLLRSPGAPFVLDGDTVRNTFVVHVVNKSDVAQEVVLTPAQSDLTFSPTEKTVLLEPNGDTRVMFVITANREHKEVTFTVDVNSKVEKKTLRGQFVTPAGP